MVIVATPLDWRVVVKNPATVQQFTVISIIMDIASNER